MVLSKKILMMVLDVYPDWGHSPERFAEFICVTMGCWKLFGEASGYGSLGILGTEQQLAEIFLNTFTEIDLRPYNSVAHLLAQTTENFDLRSSIRKMTLEIEAEDGFYELVDQGVVEQSVESIMEEAFREFRSEEIVRKLSPLIDFYE